MSDRPPNPPRVNSARVPKLALTMREAGEALGLSPRTIEQLVKTRQLRPVRVGRRVLLSVAGLRRFLRERETSSVESDQ